MARLLFSKTGNAIWISHLDLMRVFQRAFKRAGLHLQHTQGFNPRPSVSIALPLSVGVSSCCELLDFDLEGETVSNREIMERLNRSLVDGIRVLDVYDKGRKIRDLALLECRIVLEYDAGVPAGAADAVSALFARESLLVLKKGKNGPAEQDIIPMIREIAAEQPDDHSILLNALICCQNPTLNPMLIPQAIEKYLPEMKPDFSLCSRLEVYDAAKNIFR